ncbi:MAG: rubrerythrin family protein, partial [Clostridiales bacterium]|nr:rubrerythrin family protein [Clostridiales bacterium]
YGNTVENLKSAASGEHEEAEVDYPAFAQTAKEEGFDDIAESFLTIAKVESHHEARYRKLFENIENGTVFKKDGKVFWKCLNCGYVHEGNAAPDVCPACDHSQAYFQLLDDCF